MKSLIKKSLCLITAISMISTPYFALANEIEDNVKRSIDASFKHAEADATAMVAEDFGRMTDKMMLQMANYAKSQDIYKVYVGMVNELQEEFKALAAQNSSQQFSEKMVQEYMDRYAAAIRKRFAASWAPVQQTSEFEFARSMIAGLAQDFKNVCKNGRAMKSWSYLNPRIAPPGYISRFNVNVGPNWVAPFMGGIPINISYGFSSATGGSEAANRDRARALAITGTASNIATSMWISSKFAALAGVTQATTGAMATFSNAMIVAAPYLAAVAVITMIVVDTLAKAEAKRLNDQLQNALHLQGMKTADVETVNQFYRESCKEQSGALDKIVQVFADLDNPEVRSDRLNAAKLKEEQLKKWEDASGEIEASACLLELGQMYKDNGCQQLEATTKWSDLKPDAKNPKTLCAIDAAKETIFPLNMSCKLPFDKTERESILKTAKDKTEKYDKTYPAATVVELLVARLTLVFADQQKLATLWKESALEVLDRNQTLAFNQLLRLINLMQAATVSSKTSSVLAGELNAITQYTNFRKTLVDYASQGMNVIFGKTSKAPVLRKLEELNQAYAPFLQKYRHVPEVKNLGQTISAVTEQVRGL